MKGGKPCLKYIIHVIKIKQFKNEAQPTARRTEGGAALAPFVRRERDE